MQYIAYVRLAVMVLGFIKQLRESKDSGADSKTILSDMLGKIGEAADIPELKGEEVTTVLPEILSLVEALEALKK